MDNTIKRDLEDIVTKVDNIDVDEIISDLYYNTDINEIYYNILYQIDFELGGTQLFENVMFFQEKQGLLNILTEYSGLNIKEQIPAIIRDFKSFVGFQEEHLDEFQEYL